MKLKNEMLRNEGFVKGLSKLNNSIGFEIKIAYQIGRIAKTVDAQAKIVNGLIDKLFEKHGTLQPIPGSAARADGTYPMTKVIEEAKKEDYSTEYATLMGMEFEVFGDKIHIDSVTKANVTLSPLEMIGLEEIIEMGQN